MDKYFIWESTKYEISVDLNTEKGGQVLGLSSFRLTLCSPGSMTGDQVRIKDFQVFGFLCNQLKIRADADLQHNQGNFTHS